jgi:hypothetical protein
MDWTYESTTPVLALNIDAIDVLTADRESPLASSPGQLIVDSPLFTVKASQGPEQLAVAVPTVTEGDALLSPSITQRELEVPQLLAGDSRTLR